MSSSVEGFTRAMIALRSAFDSFFGVHLSNFSEYSRTAASPRFFTSARIASTVWRTFWSISSVSSRAMRRFRWVAIGSPGRRKIGSQPDFHSNAGHAKRVPHERGSPRDHRLAELLSQAGQDIDRGKAEAADEHRLRLGHIGVLSEEVRA